MSEYDHIPQALKELPNWVCWTAEPDETRPNKIKKIPINPHTGKPAQSNNSETWGSFKQAVSVSRNYSGIGFVFSNSPYLGVDIDDVEDAIEDYKTGDTDNVVSEFIHTLGSYAEYSVSGKGIHIICKGVLPSGGRRKGKYECYENGRYFIITGNIASEYTDIVDCTERIKPLHEKFIGGLAPSTGILLSLPMSLSETEIIRLAEKSKQGQTFSDLYAGRWETHFRSQSEADMSLCNMLAFWCQKDESLMESMFRRSGLMREKWDRKQSGSTYGKLTIGKAARSCTNAYEPKPEYSISIGNIPAKPPKVYTFDDTGNAEHFSDVFGEKIRYSYINKSWLFYDNRKWCFDVTGAIKRMADEVIEAMKHELKLYIDISEEPEEAEKQFMKHIKQSRSSKSKIAMIKEAEHKVSIHPDELDKHNYLLNTINGIIDLRTGELQPHNGNAFITKICHTEYTDKIDCPLWDEFLQTIFDRDQELIRFIQKSIGYSLSGSTKEDCCFFCFGTGRNGKSTFLDIISDMMGNYATNIQPETIMIKQNKSGPSGDIARLKGARFVTSAEPNDGVRIDEGLLKQLTGGDRITASKKYENEFEFTPEFKLWVATNHEPVIRGTDLGIWSRIRLIPFNFRIPDDQIDRNLKSKLKRELPGIMKWAVDGYFMWAVDGLKQPQSVLDATKLYKNNMDVISSFLDACVRIGPGSEGATDLFQAYATWAKENNEYEMKSTKFGIEMSKRFEKVRNNQGIIYNGLQLITEYKTSDIRFGKYLK